MPRGCFIVVCCFVFSARYFFPLLLSQQATTLTLPRPSLHSSNLNLAKKYRSLHERRSYSAEEWKRVQSVAQQSSAVSITLFILHQLLLLSVRHSYSCAGIEERAEWRKIIEMKCKFHNLLTQFFRARLTADSWTIFIPSRAVYMCRTRSLKNDIFLPSEIVREFEIYKIETAQRKSLKFQSFFLSIPCEMRAAAGREEVKPFRHDT